MSLYPWYHLLVQVWDAIIPAIANKQEAGDEGGYGPDFMHWEHLCLLQQLPHWGGTMSLSES